MLADEDSKSPRRSSVTLMLTVASSARRVAANAERAAVVVVRSVWKGECSEKEVEGFKRSIRDCAEARRGMNACAVATVWSRRVFKVSDHRSGDVASTGPEGYVRSGMRMRPARWRGSRLLACWWTVLEVGVW